MQIDQKSRTSGDTTPFLDFLDEDLLCKDFTSAAIWAFLAKAPDSDPTLVDFVSSSIGLGTTYGMTTYIGFAMEIKVCRIVDNFNSFLVHLLEKLFLARPEILKSNEKVSVRDILRYNSREDLVAFLAQRKLDTLAYSGFEEVVKYLRHIGVALELDEATDLGLKQAIALRNIIVHNKSVVNERYAELLVAFAKKGERIDMMVPQVVDLPKYILTAAKAINDAMVEKFGHRPFMSSAKD